MPHVPLELAFPHDYGLELLEKPGAERPVRIPKSVEEVESLLVRVTPRGTAPWVGAFALGFVTQDLISGVYAWPDGHSFAVVAAGYGYVVRADDPAQWVRLQPMPITDVRVLPEAGLIVFADFTHMYAYDGVKNLWQTERLSWDGVTVTQVATNHIFGLAWDAMEDKEVEFVVDLRTGQHTGGAKPWAKR
jgi:hypothetical protein